MKHRKHAALNRPAYGEFHRSEWAFIGATCGDIQHLTARLIATLAAHYRLAYVDADHAAADAAETLPVADAALVYTDKINFHRYDLADDLNAFHRRPLFNQVDGVLVNGNHFRAKRQIVVLDPRKEDSLHRKLDRLTDVALILTTPAQARPYDFLLEHLGENRPVMMPAGDVNGIIQWLRAQLTAARPPLRGLVLAGGKSTRMGADKSELVYHELPQAEHLRRMLTELGLETFISLRRERAKKEERVIIDAFTGLGPYGAILSAFREYPEAAWLVVACDLPLLDEEVLRALLQARDTTKMATAFHNPATGWPDPLVTIWEPRAYPVLLQFLAQGYSCPRKVLINSDIKQIEPPRADILLNANSPEEREEVLKKLSE